jgi:putative Mg2+ transporter-C (MgtC) family protein
MTTNIDLTSIVLRLLLATLFGGIIGFEREFLRQPAGLRTHMLICIGSALVMLTGQYVYVSISSSVDPTRLGAQVISGIGFLGVGTIMIVGGKQVKGLTTAAGLWASACTGLAIGIGFYSGAIVGVILIFVVETIMRNIIAYFSKYSKNIRIYVELDDRSKIEDLRDHLAVHSIKMASIEMSRDQPINAQFVGLYFNLILPERAAHSELLTSFIKLDWVSYVQEI